MTSRPNSQGTRGARLLLAVFPTWEETKDNDHGDDVEVMLLQLRLSIYTFWGSLENYRLNASGFLSQTKRI